MQVMHNRLHTPTPAPAKQGRVTEGNSGQPARVLGQGKRDPIRQLMADSFLQLLKSNVTAQPGESLHYTLVRWGGGLHLDNGEPGGALHLQSRWAGS